MTRKSVPKSEGISGMAPLVAPLVAQTALVHQKRAPSAPKVLPRIEKLRKNSTKKPPDCEKVLQKSSLLGAWPGGLREALAIRPPPLLAKGSLGRAETRGSILTCF